MGQDRIIYIFILLIVLIFASRSEAQQDTSGRFVIYGDTVYTGRTYSILLTDKTEDVCKLIAVNEKAILVLMNGETETISLEEIIRLRPITPDGIYIPAPEKGYRSITKYFIGAGIAIPLNNGDYYTRKNYSAGIDLMGCILFGLGKNTGVRMDFEYSHIGRPDAHIQGYNYEEWETGGSLDGLFIKGNFLIGDFTNRDVSFFFSAGLGVCLKFVSEYESRYSYSSPEYTYSNKSSSETIPGLALTFGASADFNLNRNLRVFVEPQVSIWSLFPVNYIAVRAGIIL
ncbi:MAG: hypothetical protein LWX07_10505 [Bacteroidetes bacterium]|nr:hypothetical protein [Bacteroidota bacterium]